jgi:hypothetical protein
MEVVGGRTSTSASLVLALVLSQRESGSTESKRPEGDSEAVTALVPNWLWRSESTRCLCSGENGDTLALLVVLVLLLVWPFLSLLLLVPLVLVVVCWLSLNQESVRLVSTAGLLRSMCECIRLCKEEKRTAGTARARSSLSLRAQRPCMAARGPAGALGVGALVLVLVVVVLLVVGGTVELLSASEYTNGYRIYIYIYKKSIYIIYMSLSHLYHGLRYQH